MCGYLLSSNFMKPYLSSFLLLIVVFALIIYGCQPANTTLPIMGERKTVTKIVNGKEVTDTVYHQIRNFAFLDQDSVLVTNETFKGKIYVADFFFTTCPTICPIMKTQLLRVSERYKNNPKVGILSHTIDPGHDTIPLLKEYKHNLGIDNPNWHFVWGNRDTIYSIGEKDYYVPAYADSTAPGGYVHSGGFILVDKNRHVRGIFNGTQQQPVDSLMMAIDRLLLEQ